MQSNSKKRIVPLLRHFKLIWVAISWFGLDHRILLFSRSTDILYP